MQRRPQPGSPDVDEARLLPIYRRADLEREQGRGLTEVLRETDDSLDELKANPRAPAGDRRRLRGIPAVGGRGSIGGAIAGTNPEDCIDRIDEERRRWG